jgi:hypothetical protein
MVLDVKGAYLKSPIGESKQENLHLKLYDGSIVKLHKYIYGLKQAGYEWELNLTTTLLANGYVQSDTDNRAFSKTYTDGKFINMAIHVDDFLVVASNHEILKQLHSQLEAKYGEVSIKTGDMLEYLGMQITIDKDNSILLNQPLYAREVCTKFLSKDLWVTPGHQFKNPISSTGLVPKPDDDDLVDQNYYLQVIGSLNYLAQFTRPDFFFYKNSRLR